MVSAFASVIGFFIVNYFYMTGPAHWRDRLAFRHACATLGIVLAIVTLWLTNYFTHPDKGPVTETAHRGAHRPGDADSVGPRPKEWSRRCGR